MKFSKKLRSIAKLGPGNIDPARGKARETAAWEGEEVTRTAL